MFCKQKLGTLIGEKTWKLNRKKERKKERLCRAFD